MTHAFVATAAVNMIHKSNCLTYLCSSNILSAPHTWVVLLCVHCIQTWLFFPDPCLVLIFSSLVLFNNLSTGLFPQSTLQVQTKRRLAVDLTDNFTALRIWFFTVRSFSLSLLADTHPFFFLSISSFLLLCWTTHLSFMDRRLQPLWKDNFFLKALSPSEKLSL